MNKHILEFELRIKKEDSYGGGSTGFDVRIREPIPKGMDPMDHLKKRLGEEYKRNVDVIEFDYKDAIDVSDTKDDIPF